MEHVKPNEPPTDPEFRDGIDDDAFKVLGDEADLAFERHAQNMIRDARTEYDAAEQTGDSRQADRAAGTISRLAMAVASHQERMADAESSAAPDRIAITVHDNSGPAEMIQVNHPVAGQHAA